MIKIVKFIYVMIIVISLFLVATNDEGNPVLILFIFLSLISTQFYLIFVKLFYSLVNCRGLFS